MSKRYELSQAARHEALQARVQYYMVKAAVAKLNEASPATKDVELARRILDNGEPMLTWSLAVLTNPTIAAVVTKMEDFALIDDNDLEFAVNSMWSAFAA
jgi:hypothetical protein